MNPNGGSHHLHNLYHVFTALNIFEAAAELRFTAFLQNSHGNMSLLVLSVASEVTGITEITSLLYICRKEIAVEGCGIFLPDGS